MARVGVQYGHSVGEAPVDLRVQRGFRRRPCGRADGSPLQIDEHDVVCAQAPLVAAGNRHRRVVGIDAHGEIAAGGRRPTESGQIAPGSGDFAGTLAQVLGVEEGQGGHRVGAGDTASHYTQCRRGRRRVDSRWRLNGLTEVKGIFTVEG